MQSGHRLQLRLLREGIWTCSLGGVDESFRAVIDYAERFPGLLGDVV